MKKRIILAFAAFMMMLNASAQTSTNSKYYSPATSRPDYMQHSSLLRKDFAPESVYYGFRMGPAFSTISSDDNASKASEMRTGVNIGVVIGAEVVDDAPLFIESGLYYIRKGGNAKYNGTNLQKTLDYLLVPVVFKYSVNLIDDVYVQPFAGLYGALGTGGKIKDYGDHSVKPSFEEDFNRFDGGLRFGCGFYYSPFYVEVGYDLGLTNVSKQEFYTAHNRSLLLTFGVNL